MEVPLNRARGMADALDFVGHGLEHLEHDGAWPVLTLAGELMEDQDEMRESWLAMTRTLDKA